MRRVLACLEVMMVCWSGLLRADPTFASSLLCAMPTELVKSVAPHWTVKEKHVVHASHHAGYSDPGETQPYWESRVESPPPRGDARLQTLGCKLAGVAWQCSADVDLQVKRKQLSLHSWHLSKRMGL